MALRLRVAALCCVLPTCVGAPEPRRSATDVAAGGKLKVVSQAVLDDLDPARMYDTTGWFLARGVFRTLTTADDDSGLAPDLATDTGRSNADLTEWTFTIKDGVRYGLTVGGTPASGITGEQIVCDDFAYAFERMFTPAVEGRYLFYYDDVEGVDEFVSGRAENIAGISCTDQRTITFRLNEPAGDWPYRLSLPATSPVPRAFASTYDASASSSYGTHALATGPYYVDESGLTLRLLRNPHWNRATDESRSAEVDELHWRQGVDPSRALTRILNGRFDTGVDLTPPGSELVKLVTRRPPNVKVVNEPTLCTRYVFLNTTQEPFDHPLVRRAVNVALDRANLKRLQGGPTSGQIATSVLPPGIAGSLPPARYNPFKTAGMAGDVAQAQRLMERAGLGAGWDGEIVLVGAAEPPDRQYAESVRQDLERIGFTRVEEKLLPYPKHYTAYYLKPKRDTDVGVSAGWCKDYNDAFTFFGPLWHGDNITPSNNQNFSEIDDAVLNAAIDRASELPLGEQRAEGWQQANRLATESGAWVPWSWDKATIVYRRELVDAPYSTFLSNLDWVNVVVRR